jgi:hypothetical protein
VSYILSDTPCHCLRAHSLLRRRRVLKRVIKGGPIDHPKRERGLLLCPSGFLVDTVSGRARDMITPVPVH